MKPAFESRSVRKMKLTKRLIILLLIFCILVYIYILATSEKDSMLTYISRLRYNQVDVENLLPDGPIVYKKNFLTLDGNADLLRKYLNTLPASVYRRTGVSCERLFSGVHSTNETLLALTYMHNNIKPVTTIEDFDWMADNCTNFKEKRAYMPLPESEHEASFPIAYSILAYHDLEQMEKLLRAIYAPQNFYCIHVDAKISEKMLKVIRKIVSCFTNVFFPDELVNVWWGHISIMQAEMLCLEKLLQYKWKYFINLSGQMFPLKSNAEIVSVLKMYNGANDIEGSSRKDFYKWFRQALKWKHSNLINSNVFMPMFKPTPPHNVTLYTGTNQVILSRQFAVYFLYSKISLDLIEWFSDTLVPDEYIWPTLNHNPHLQVPGGYKGNPDTKPFISRLTLWEPILPFSSRTADWDCRGVFIRNICIFGVGDLTWIVKHPHLFVNKFHSDYQWLSLECMEELVLNKTKNYLLQNGRKNSQYLNKNSVGTYGDFNLGKLSDLTFYENLPFILDPSLVNANEELDFNKLFK